MIKYPALLIITGLLLVSCGKKNENVTQKETPKPQQQQQQNQTQQQKSSFNSYKVTNVGSGGKNEMVDFTWNENGKDVKLSDFKGKVIVVNFWATWCGPCKREIPALSQITTELKDKDFKMVGVSVDDDPSVLNGFLQAYNVNYTVVHEPEQLVMKYMESTGQNQNVVPQTYIIDKKGKVVETILGARSKTDFLSIINKYL